MCVLRAFMCAAILDNVRTYVLYMLNGGFDRRRPLSHPSPCCFGLPFTSRLHSPCIPRMVHVFNALANSRPVSAAQESGYDGNATPRSTYVCIIDRTTINPHKYINHDKGMQQMCWLHANGNQKNNTG